MNRISLIEAYDNRSVIKQIADLFRFKQDKLTARNAGTNVEITGEGEDLKINVVTEPVGSISWGNIAGSINDQLDLKTALNGKQPYGDYATNVDLAEGLAEKQDVGDYATNSDLTEGLAGKQDYSVNIRNIIIGTSEVPSDSIGEDGDLYVYKP